MIKCPFKKREEKGVALKIRMKTIQIVNQIYLYQFICIGRIFKIFVIIHFTIIKVIATNLQHTVQNLNGLLVGNCITLFSLWFYSFPAQKGQAVYTRIMHGGNHLQLLFVFHHGADTTGKQ